MGTGTLCCLASGLEFVGEFRFEPCPVLGRDLPGHVVTLDALEGRFDSADLGIGLSERLTSQQKVRLCLVGDPALGGFEVDVVVQQVFQEGRIDHISLKRWLIAELAPVVDPTSAHVAVMFGLG